MVGDAGPYWLTEAAADKLAMVPVLELRMLYQPHRRQTLAHFEATIDGVVYGWETPIPDRDPGDEATLCYPERWDWGWMCDLLEFGLCIFVSSVDVATCPKTTPSVTAPRPGTS